MAGGKLVDAAAQLANVLCPVLVIMGSKDPDWPEPEAEAAAIVGLLPAGRGRYVMIENAGPHTPTRNTRNKSQTPSCRSSPRALLMPRAGLNTAEVVASALTGESGPWPRLVVAGGRACRSSWGRRRPSRCCTWCMTR